MTKPKIGSIVAVVGGTLAIVGPFLTASTVTMTIGSLVRADLRSWIEMSPLFYLCVGSGALAVLAGTAAQIRPKAVWSLLLAVSAIVIAVLLVMAQVKMAETVGTTVLEVGIALGARWGEAPTAFEIASGMGFYFLVLSFIVLALAAPLVALKK
jgi:hypothetical protein